MALHLTAAANQDPLDPMARLIFDIGKERNEIFLSTWNAGSCRHRISYLWLPLLALFPHRNTFSFLSLCDWQSLKDDIIVEQLP
jgi:hypothetical protein